MRQELEATKAELAEKIQATAQFQQLQRLMVAKNDLIKDLRAKVKALEGPKE